MECEFTRTGVTTIWLILIVYFFQWSLLNHHLLALKNTKECACRHPNKAQSSTVPTLLWEDNIAGKVAKVLDCTYMYQEDFLQGELSPTPKKLRRRVILVSFMSFGGNVIPSVMEDLGSAFSRPWMSTIVVQPSGITKNQGKNAEGSCS